MRRLGPQGPRVEWDRRLRSAVVSLIASAVDETVRLAGRCSRRCTLTGGLLEFGGQYVDAGQRKPSLAIHAARHGAEFDFCQVADRSDFVGLLHLRLTPLF